MKVNFTKMQGLGNDFVVIDATEQAFSLSPSKIQKMANRRFGVGFDQLLVIEPSKQKDTDFHFRIFNADGSEVGQCGNGARCIARFIREKGLSRTNQFRISTICDTLMLTLEADDKVSVQIGVPHFAPAQIPFVANEIANHYQVDVGNQKVTLS